MSSNEKRVRAIVVPGRFDGDRNQDMFIVAPVVDRGLGWWLYLMEAAATHTKRFFNYSIELAAKDLIYIDFSPRQLPKPSKRSGRTAVLFDDLALIHLTGAAQRPATLYAGPHSFCWVLEPGGWERGLRTGPVTWQDLMEWRLWTTEPARAAVVLRELTKRDPKRALAAVARGPYPGSGRLRGLRPTVLEPLLTHTDPEIRIQAIALLSSCR